jgi:hypothetical protein
MYPIAMFALWCSITWLVLGWHRQPVASGHGFRACFSLLVCLASL